MYQPASVYRCNAIITFVFIAIPMNYSASSKKQFPIRSFRRLASASPWGDCPSSWLLLWGDRGTCRWSFDTSLEWFFATPLLWLGVGLALLLQSFGPVVPVSRFQSPRKEFGCFVWGWSRGPQKTHVGHEWGRCESSWGLDNLASQAVLTRARWDLSWTLECDLPIKQSIQTLL